MSSEIYALSKSNTKGGFYLIYTDNKDFYPTPKPLFERLLNGKRYLDGRILEPSAGKGDMIRYIKERMGDRKSTRLNSSHVAISYAVFCLTKQKRLRVPAPP